MSPSSAVLRRVVSASAVTLLCTASLQAQSGLALGALGSHRATRDLGDSKAMRNARLSGPAPLTIDLVPSASFTDGSNTWGGSLEFGREALIGGMDGAASLSYRLLHAAGSNHHQLKAGIELDPLADQLVLGLPMSLALTAEYANISGVSSGQEVAGELDAVLAERESVKLSVAGMAYYDREKPKGGESDGGMTMAAGVTLKLWNNTKINAEYDFESDFSGESSYSVKISHAIQSVASHPAVFAGAGKHGVYIAGLSISIR